MTPATKRPAKKTAVVRELVHDTGKTLKGGKRRYVDDPDSISKTEYLDADEVLKLGSPDAITVTIESA